VLRPDFVRPRLQARRAMAASSSARVRSQVLAISRAQPAFAPGARCAASPLRNPRSMRSRVVNRMLEGAGRAGSKAVADHEWRLSFGERSACTTSTCEVSPSRVRLSRRSQRARILIGWPRCADAARQHRGQHAVPVRCRASAREAKALRPPIPRLAANRRNTP